jgi:hypothetical protein
MPQKLKKYYIVFKNYFFPKFPTDSLTTQAQDSFVGLGISSYLVAIAALVNR